MEYKKCICSACKTLVIFIISLISITALSGFKSFASDTTAPITTPTYSPASPNGNNGWYVTPVNVALSATDLESGVAQINYRIDNGTWQTTAFSNSLNLAPNPSFENIDYSNTPIIADWSATKTDAETTYSRDSLFYLSGYNDVSAKITTTGISWHGINNQNSFVAASPLANMSASVWLKTDTVETAAYFKVYSVASDGLGGYTYSYIGQSSSVTGTVGFTKVSATFVVSDPAAIGVYVDIGLDGAGTVWADAVEISLSNITATVNFAIATNGIHTLEYYASDQAGNLEFYSCLFSPKVNCDSVKIDQNPPSNWHDSGAIRGVGGGADHELYVYTTIEDLISGISSNTNKYQYHVPEQLGFGHYTELLHCNTPWLENNWVDLGPATFSNGDPSGQLITQKTDFCNDDWKNCKIVKFYAEDVAGNSTTKDFCLNGPWIHFTGQGIVRANGGIDMVAEPEEVNTDGIIEIGNEIISFFSSSNDWLVQDSPTPTNYDYAKLLSIVTPTPSTISGNLVETSGVYLFNSNFEIQNSTIPNGYNNSTFNQIYFINGDLLISNDISVDAASTALFIVQGKVEIAKGVNELGIAIIADGDIYTAYDVTEGQTSNTLNLSGFYVANQFHFQRTLQGANNAKYPSESFIYEPKYTTNLKDYLGTNTVRWLSSD